MSQQSLLTITRNWAGTTVQLNPDALPACHCSNLASDCLADHTTRGEDRQVA